MRPKRVDTNDLLDTFHKTRNQILTNKVDKPITNHRPKSRTEKVQEETRNDWLHKYTHLAEYVDSFKSQDIVKFFLEKNRESGQPKFVVSSYSREVGVAKRLLQMYPARDVCLMIEFLYDSDQDYLEKDRLSLGLISSSWCNTIHADALLWANDEYSPKSKKTPAKEVIQNREWKKTSSEPSTQIGAWDE